ncbi:hypothetical protein [Candidatus Odyssella thessalonicensis]|uniref:hypothetical protein n=1 Tax=Candidatus Odyssella thessalonicensis TaxID=84647 RepID=UPI000225C1BF|nr:hypothetical protein [Candidatus Odyssella thessalonicensis]
MCRGTRTAVADSAGILTAARLNALVIKDREGEAQSTNIAQGVLIGNLDLTLPFSYKIEVRLRIFYP